MAAERATVESIDEGTLLAEQLASLARELGRADRDWTILAEGNCSASEPDGRMLVKTSGAMMASSSPKDFVEVDRNELLAIIDDPSSGDGDVEAVFTRGAEHPDQKRPSVESLLHAVCLDLPGVSVVGHTHPVAVNAILCSDQPTTLVKGALIPDQVVVLGASPMLVPYVDPGLSLARHVRLLLLDRSASPRVIYLQNHGMFALGSTAREVIQITEMAVKVSKMLVGAMSIGEPVYMSAADVTRIDTRPDEQLRRAVLKS